MKLANLLLITALVGVLSVLGCDDGGGGTAGSGGDGTAGSGGSAGSGGATGGSGGGGIVCDPTVEATCSTCEIQDRIPDCVSTYNSCLETDPSLNPCEKCGVTALAQCRE